MGDYLLQTVREPDAGHRESDHQSRGYCLEMICADFTRTPAPGTTRVRLLVRDNDSGKTGSVDIPYRSVSVADAAQPTPTVRNSADSPTPR